MYIPCLGSLYGHGRACTCTSKCIITSEASGSRFLVPFVLSHNVCVSLFAAAASPTGVEDDLWSDFVQSGQSEVCINNNYSLL